MLRLLPETVSRAASFEGLIVIAIIYAILTVVGKLKEAANRGKPQPPREVRRPRRPPVEYPSPAETARRPAPPLRRAPPPDTRSEATRLEELLRGLGQLAGMPEAEEERESLEVEPEAVSLEAPEPVRRRVLVDQDEGAEALVQRRIDAAQARNRALTPADHAEFDKRIKSAADATRVAVKRGAGNPMRNAIIWREILGPPKALKIDD